MLAFGERKEEPGKRMLTDEHIKYFKNFDWKRWDEIVVEVKVAIAEEKKQKAIKKGGGSSRHGAAQEKKKNGDPQSIQ